MTAPVNKVTYIEIFISLIKTAPPMIIAGLIYKPLRSLLVHDQYMTAIADAAFFFLIFYIARWGVGDILKRLRDEEEKRSQQKDKTQKRE